MNRLKTVEELKVLEEKREIINENMNALKSSYYKHGSLSLQLKTSDFNYEGCDKSFEFDKNLMLEYLEKELEAVDKKVNMLIKQLTEK